MNKSTLQQALKHLDAHLRTGSPLNATLMAESLKVLIEEKLEECDAEGEYGPDIGDDPSL